MLKVLLAMTKNMQTAALAAASKVEGAWYKTKTAIDLLPIFIQH